MNVPPCARLSGSSLSLARYDDICRPAVTAGDHASIGPRTAATTAKVSILRVMVCVRSAGCASTPPRPAAMPGGDSCARAPSLGRWHIRSPNAGHVKVRDRSTTRRRRTSWTSQGHDQPQRRGQTPPGWTPLPRHIQAHRRTLRTPSKPRCARMPDARITGPAGQGRERAQATGG